MHYNNKLKKTRLVKLAVIAVISFLVHSAMVAQRTTDMKTEKKPTIEKDGQQELTPEQYRVLRECGTEPAFTGKYVNHHEDGYYHCAGCGARLFSSDTKYDSGSGWPSFYKAVADSSIIEVLDKSYGMIRTEIKCGTCGGHLGHVFNDGPNPTGLRYCVNSLSLDFKKD